MTCWYLVFEPIASNHQILESFKNTFKRRLVVYDIELTLNSDKDNSNIGSSNEKNDNYPKDNIDRDKSDDPSISVNKKNDMENLAKRAMEQKQYIDNWLESLVQYSNPFKIGPFFPTYDNLTAILYLMFVTVSAQLILKYPWIEKV